MESRILRFIPLIVLAVLAGVMLWGLEKKEQKNTQQTIQTLDKPLPVIDVVQVEGVDRPNVDIAALKGKKVLLNFFASWCAPCQAEHSFLQEIAADPRWAVVGIAWHDEHGKVMQYLSDRGNPFTQLGLDERSRTGIEFGLQGLPESFLIDEHGKLVGHIDGMLTRSTVQQLLGKATP